MCMLQCTVKNNEKKTWTFFQKILLVKVREHFKVAWIRLNEMKMSHSSVQVKLPNQQTGSFGINSELNQGYVLIPTLFNIVLENAIRKLPLDLTLLPKLSVNVNGDQLYKLSHEVSYEDDINIPT